MTQSEREAPSENTRGRSRMQLVGERQSPDGPPPTPPTLTQAAMTQRTTQPDVNLPKEYVARSAWKQSVLGTLNVAFLVLAVRLILLLAVLGAVALTWLALAAPDPLRMAAVGLYTVTVVIPLIWLSARGG